MNGRVVGAIDISNQIQAQQNEEEITIKFKPGEDVNGGLPAGMYIFQMYN